MALMPVAVAEELGCLDKVLVVPPAHRHVQTPLLAEAEVLEVLEEVIQPEMVVAQAVVTAVVEQAVPTESVLVPEAAAARLRILIIIQLPLVHPIV
jgi:hypothetical protein